MPAHQSACRKYHSTETAIIRVYDDLLKATDNEQISALSLLDLTAAFDTVDHKLLLARMLMCGAGTRLVQIILNWQYILCDLCLSFVFHRAGDTLRSTGNRRIAIVFIIHGRSFRLGSQAWCDVICFRRRHAALYPMRIFQRGNIEGCIRTLHTGYLHPSSE